ncbi:MAG: transcriptional regulator [Cyanobacteria bacterium RYN_339]|nr:transcriptional regulator [Cyanobacteria bacterium RYN_339]
MFIFNHMVNRHDKPQIATLDGVYGALSAAIRRRILEQLRDRPMVVAELAATFDVSWPAVSRHLRVLEEEGLVERRKDGRLHHIHLVPGKLAEAGAWLAGFDAPAALVLPEPEPALDRAWAAAARLYRELGHPIALITEALDRSSSMPGAPAGYLAAVLRRRLAGDPGLKAWLADGCRSYLELGTWLNAPDRDPACVLELTYALGQLAYALRTDPRLQDLTLAS